MRGHDFDGDGYGDLLWRRDDGLIAVWRGTAAGLRQDIGFSQLVTADWSIAGKGDFDGDGNSDILWRKADGQVTVWSSTGSRFDATFNQIVDTRWQIATTGDFDGDGRDDILWRRDDGLTTVWCASGTGFTDVGGSPPLPADFRDALSGDYDGDGRDDIRWVMDGDRTVWFSTGNTFVAPFSFPLYTQGDVAGDINGDGFDDILRGEFGTTVDLMTPYGSTYVTLPRADEGWRLEGVADLNGDGREDLIWRNDDGTLTHWQAVNAFTVDPAQPALAVSTDWTLML